MVARLFKSGRLFKSERMFRGSAASAALRYAATLTVTVGVAMWGGVAAWDAIIDAPVAQSAGATGNGAGGVPQTASAVLESDDWMQNIRSEKYWASNRAGNSQSRTAKPDFSQRSGLIKTWAPTSAPEAPASKPQDSSKSSPQYSKAGQPKSERTDGSDWYEGDGGNHRTVCVRLCDGYFWPISFSTDSDNFDRDKRVCEKSCGSPTRLFVHDNPGQDVEQMADLKGNPYAKLRTAFLFRTSYDESCKCNAHPWEQASKDRHRIYALEAEKRKGSQQAAAELTRMKSALIEARKAATAVRTAAVETVALKAGAVPAAASKRIEAPMPVVMAGHSPLSATLTRSSELAPVGAFVTMQEPASANGSLPDPYASVVKRDRLQQWAQMTPQALPPTASSEAAVQSAIQPTAPKTAADAAVRLPALPFALPVTPPAIGGGLAGVVAALLNPGPPKPASTSAGASAQAAAQAKPKSPPATIPNKLPVSAPPIVSGANAELGINAPLAVNTAQLEQVNVPRKPSGDQPNVAEKATAKVEPKSEPKPVPRAEPQVAAAEPPPRPKPRPSEPRVVERREPERPQPEPRQERRVIVARPAPAAPAPRVVERPAPRPVRVVEAPRPAPQVARVRPQQYTAVRSDNWRVRVFESR
jgi:Protein of unknown function (DUF2865)